MTTEDAKRYVQDHPNDPRCEPFHRKDGYRKVSRVLPDPASDRGWLCPGCGKPTLEFYGEGPPFEDGRYVEPDQRRCIGCWHAEHNGPASPVRPTMCLLDHKHTSDCPPVPPDPVSIPKGRE